jgi:hypothetical protein
MGLRRIAMRTLLLGGALAVALVGAASAATSEAKNTCFRSSEWSGWRAPDENTLYLRVRMHDVYRVDLSSGSSMLNWPSVHLVNVVHGSDLICSPLDLQLSVSDNGGSGMKTFLIAKAITKLTPEQAAAIPKKFQP